MTLTTDEYWEVDGVALSTYAWNVASWGGGRRGVPPLRGGDDLVPFRAGEVWLPKMAGSRVITLGMWGAWLRPAGVGAGADARSVQRQLAGIAALDVAD